MKEQNRIGSLRLRFFFVLFLTAIILSIVTIVGSYMIYSKALGFRYESLCKAVSETVAGSIDADSVNLWLKGKNMREYIDTNSMLRQLNDGVSDLGAIIIRQMRSDGMYTIFDTNSTAIRGGIGEFSDYDSRWGAYKQKFLAGKNVGTITVNSTGGKMLMYCVPVFDSQSNCVCYAGSGVPLSLIEDEGQRFMKKNSARLLMLALLISFVLALFIEWKITRPLKKIYVAAEKSTKASDFESIKKITELKIKTGDEIENIWRSLIKIFTDKVQIMSTVRKAQENTVLTFATLTKRIDSYTGAHVDNALQYVIILTNALRKKEKYKDIITDEEYINIIQAAPLHDIGKLSVPDCILNKPARLTVEEFEIMKEHTIYGAKLLEEAIKDVKDAKYLELARQLCESHHERWDGMGYPYGLKGEEIPLPVRIIAVADVFNALVSERCYKNSMPFNDAYDIIAEESGTHFDPDIVEVFLEIKNEVFEIYSKLRHV